MPTYEYRCADCGQHIEVVQSFTDDALTVCGACGGSLKKVFGSVGIVFKGSGFYKTDSRGGSSKPGSEKSTTSDTGTKSDSASSDSPKSDTSKSGAKSDTKPSTSSSTSGGEAKSA
jgi:putative FmdB family regulatory protein